jgi:hypothetical protein
MKNSHIAVQNSKTGENMRGSLKNLAVFAKIVIVFAKQSQAIFVKIFAKMFGRFSRK